MHELAGPGRGQHPPASRERRPPPRLARPAAACAAGALLVVAGAAAAGAAPATLYVNRSSPSCSNSGPGSAAVPYCSIARAATVAAAGQTVLVAAGTYNETVTVARSGGPGAPITFRANGAVTVRGGTNGFRVSSKSWITVRGFRVSDTVKEGILLSGAHHVTVTGNRVTSAGTPASGQIAQGIKLVNTNDATVSANTTDHNSEAGIQLTGTSTRNLVSANLSYQNARGYVRAAPGIDVRAPGNQVIANRAHHNEDTGIQANPLFANAGAGDFHLGAGSPAVDSANSGVSGRQAVDAEGRRRTDVPGVPNRGIGPRGYDDRGALEQ